MKVCGPVVWWVSHWDVAAWRSRRCGGPECAMCWASSPTQVRIVLALDHPKVGRCLLELRERHRPLAELLHNSESTGVGAVLKVQRAGCAKNTPIDVEFQRWDEVSNVWDPGPLVDVVGLPPLLRESAVRLEVG